MGFPDGTSGKESEVAQLCPAVCGPMDYTIQSMGFSRPEYQSGEPFLSPGDLPSPGTEPFFCVAGGLVTSCVHPPANAGDTRHRFSPWVGKIRWRSTWQPTWAFLLENPMERGAWRATVCGITKSRTQLRRLTQTHTHCYNSKLSLITCNAMLCISC